MKDDTLKCHTTEFYITRNKKKIEQSGKKKKITVSSNISVVTSLVYCPCR